MKILVTGGNGFLGSAVLRSLVGRGHEVVAVHRRADSSPGEIPPVSWVAGDVLRPQEMSSLLESVRPEGLMHLAWVTSHGTYWSSSENLLWAAASLYLIEAFARSGGRRLVVAGTSAEYSWAGGGTLDEATTELLPNGLYGVSKNALRSMVKAWAAESGLSWSWGRIFNLFGPGERKERMIPRIITSLLRGEPVTLDDGLTYRDFLHVDEAGDAFAALIESEVQGPVNIASGEAVSIRRLVESIAGFVGASELVSFDPATRRPEGPRSVVASVERLQREVGWSPALSFLERLEAVCDWWRERAEP